MKAIICFKKQGPAKYISHLDLQRTVDRALRRSGVDVVFSSGYNPHIKMSFAFALKVGMTSESEYLEVEVGEKFDIAEAGKRIKNSFPEGLEVNWVRLKKEGAKKLMASVSKAGYEIILNNSNDFDKVEYAIKKILNLEALEVIKKTKKGLKSFDAIPLIHSLEFDKERGKINAILSAQEAGTLDPKLLADKIMLVAGMNCEYTVIRKNLYTRVGDEIFPLSALTK